MIISTEGIYTLFDDASVREKLKVMDKWDVMLDDSRNPTSDLLERVDAVLELGKSYRIRIDVTIEEI